MHNLGQFAVALQDLIIARKEKPSRDRGDTDRKDGSYRDSGEEQYRSP